MTGTRERIVGAASELFRARGYTGTGLKQISATSSAPFGSMYHFFPGGKEELGAEAIRASGQWFADLGMSAFGDATDLPDAMRLAFTRAAEDLVAGDYADACPVATVALETSSTSETLRTACAEVFEFWIATLAGVFASYGVPSQRTRPLALQAISALEGAFVLSRASRDTESLHAAGELMAERARAELA